MALPSQTARVASSRSPMFRRKRTSARPFVIGGGIVVTAIIIGAVWSMGGPRPDDPTTPLTSTERIADGRSGTPNPAPPAITPARHEPKPEFKPELKVETRPPPTPPQPPVEHKPLVIRQGQPNPAPALSDTARPAVPERPVSPPDSTPAKAVPMPEQKPAGLSAPGAPDRPDSTGSPTPGLPAEIQTLVAGGRQKSESREWVAARQLLSRALAHARTPEAERARLREDLTRINDELVFSPRAAADDPFVVIYAVQSGDGLERIAKRNGVQTHWRLIQRVNQLANPNKVRLNQKLKLVKGPFHAVVTKSAFRMDIFIGPADAPADWLYIRSFRVGLGEGGGTPVGDFVVRKGSKLENPYWTNPRTGEQFSKEDPKNPIGERWIGLEGVGDSAVHSSYGIHGTIDPDSIGQERSMGCVRLGAQDVELVYDLLGEGVSRVKIGP